MKKKERGFNSILSGVWDEHTKPHGLYKEYHQMKRDKLAHNDNTKQQSMTIKQTTNVTNTV